MMHELEELPVNEPAPQHKGLAPRYKEFHVQPEVVMMPELEEPPRKRMRPRSNRFRNQIVMRELEGLPINGPAPRYRQDFVQPPMATMPTKRPPTNAAPWKDFTS